MSDLLYPRSYGHKTDLKNAPSERPSNWLRPAHTFSTPNANWQSTEIEQCAFSFKLLTGGSNHRSRGEGPSCPSPRWRRGA